MKKIICLILSLILMCTVALPVCADNDMDGAGYSGYPVVVVRGIDFGGFYLGDKSPAISFELQDIFLFLKNYLKELVFQKNEDAFLDSSLSLVSEILGPIALDKEGNSVYEVYFDKYEKSMANYLDEIPLMENVGECGIVKSAIDAVGADNVYYFTYDWRKSAKEISADLDIYIDNALNESESDKVNIVAVSMGGMVTSAYLYWHGNEKVNNLTFVSSAHNGTYGPGDAFNGDIYFDGNVIYSRIKKSFAGNPLKSLFLALINKIGIFDALGSVANKIVKDNPQALNNGALRDGFGTLLGLWAMCPDDVFESGVDFLFGGYENEYPVLMEKLNETKEFIFSTEEIIDGAIEKGVKITFVSNYNTPLGPYYKHSYLQGDGVLETVLTSNFATVAEYGQTLSGLELSDAEPGYVSPDRIVDATDAVYRDITWFVKDAPHVAAEYESDYADFVMWLILSEEQPTIRTNERYPQFLTLDKNDNLIITQ